MAMLDAVAQNGYRATTVADLITRAGVSRKAFYTHFANKQECLLGTAAMVFAEALRRVEDAYRSGNGRSASTRDAILAVFQSATASPGALRVGLVELPAIGPAGIALREFWLGRFEHLFLDLLEPAPSEAYVPNLALKAIVGGFYRVLYRRVISGEHAELLALVPDLVAWATCYYPTPEGILTELRRDVPHHAPERGLLEGGRAPGTLAPHGVLSSRRGLLRGDQNVSARYVAYNQRERILDAVVNLTAANGYADLKVEDIALEAAVSLHALYEHFGGKEEAFLVAYEVGHDKGLAIVERAYAAQSDWRLGVRAGIAALFAFLSSEPAFAHIALIDVLTATRLTAERSSMGVGGFAQLLVPGLNETRTQIPPSAVTIEAVAGGIFELCLHYALRGQIASLSELTESATYIALAPFIGAEQAAQVASEQAPSDC